MAYNRTLQHFTSSQELASPWTSSQSYLLNQLVLNNDVIYRATIAHTSAASFATDLAANRWEIITSVSSDTKNYILNPKFNSGNTGSWGVFKTTLTSQIPTGSIGAADAGFSITATSTTPLSGAYSGLLASTGVLAIGNGLISDAFTIDREDQAKVMGFSFYYEAVSGTQSFAGTTANTWAVYIYDVTNSAWIQPAGVYNLTQGSGVGLCSGTFQTTSNSTQYRIALICITATSGAVSLEVDDFQLGPQKVVYGSPVTDWVSYTPTINWTAGVGFGVYGRYRRVGDSLHAQVYIPISGLVTATQLRINIPSGLTIDSSKIPGVISFNQTIPVGTWSGLRTGSAFYNGVVDIASSNSVWLSVNANGNVVTNTVPVTWDNGDYISCEFFAPVTGWSSTVQMSQDTDTRVVAALATKSGTQVLSATTTTVTGWAISADTHGAMSTTGTYTVPVTGWYEIGQFFTLTGASGLYGNLVNISGAGLTFFGNYVTSDRVQSSTLRYLTAGSTIVPGIYSSASSGTISAGEWWVKRVSGPSAIAASESVNAIYNTNAGQSVAAALTTIRYGTKIKDSHNAYNTGTGIYTVPVSGVYQVTAAAYFTTNSTVTQLFQIRAVQGGSATRTVVMNGVSSQNTVTNDYFPSGSTDLYCLAGDTIQIQFFNGTLVGNLNANADVNFMNIRRVGN